MSKIFKIDNAKELLDYMERGYLFDNKQIMNFLNISKTQYYDYVHGNVNMIRVSAAVRKELEQLHIEDEYLYFFVSHLLITKKTNLLRFEEVLYFMIIKEYIKVELYNTEEAEYKDVTLDIILGRDRKVWGETLVLLEKAVFSAIRWNEHDPDFINNGKKPTNNYKTKFSRFQKRIKSYKHFRFNTLGGYSYAIIENIGKNMPEFMQIKRDNHDFYDKISGD